MANSDRQIVYQNLTTIQSNNCEISSELKNLISDIVKNDNKVLFAELCERENLTFPAEFYCELVKNKALRIIFYLFVEIRTQQEQKMIEHCYSNIQKPEDAGSCGKRNSNPKPMVKTMSVKDYCNVPQSVFELASQMEDKRVLQFLIAIGIPVDIETYNKSRRSSSGWCSSLQGSLNRNCRPNLKKVDGIMKTM